jgi:hypothetical protein
MPSSSEPWKTHCLDQSPICTVWPAASSAAYSADLNSSPASFDTQASPLQAFREDH